jgi:hypothetical protein
MFPACLGEATSGEGTLGVVDDTRGDPFNDDCGAPPSDDTMLLRGNDKLAAAAFPHGIVGEEMSECC